MASRLGVLTGLLMACLMAIAVGASLALPMSGAGGVCCRVGSAGEHDLPSPVSVGRGRRSPRPLNWPPIDRLWRSTNSIAPGPGDWVVGGREIREGEVIVLSGNLTVEPGGSLTLINCTLLLNCTYDGECWIVVEEGGALEVLGGSTITAYDPKHEFFFLVLGRLFMRDSTLSECGFNLTYMGLLLYTDEGVLLENVTITKCYYGVSTYKSANITVRDCKIVDNEEYGVVCYKSSDMLIENVTITRCYYGISICESTNVTIGDCEIVGNEEDGIVCHESSDILISSCVIGNNRKRSSMGLWLCCSSNIIISNCVVSRNKWGVVLTHCNYITMVGCVVTYSTDWGVGLSMCSDVEIVNCTVAHNFDGMEVLGYDITIRGCSICHNDDWGLVCEGAGIEVRYCNICHNGDWGLTCEGEGIEVHYCNIYSNGDVGLYNFADALVNATYCWWHDPSGPEYKRKGDLRNPEEVYSDYGREYLAYEPWLTEPWMPSDEEPPDVVLIEPENSSYVRGVVTIRAEASDNEAIDRVEFYVNATLLLRDYEAPYECEWITLFENYEAVWPDGLYVLEAVAYDGVGNSDRTATMIVVDNTPPTIYLVRHTPEEPAEGQEVTVEANVSDAVSGLAKVVLWYRVDNGAWIGVEMTRVGGVWVATIPSRSAGSKVEYFVEARDKAGNTIKSGIVTYQVEPRRREELLMALAVVVAAADVTITVVVVYFLRRRR